MAPTRVNGLAPLPSARITQTSSRPPSSHW
jgi:hypothetical protein